MKPWDCSGPAGEQNSDQAEGEPRSHQKAATFIRGTLSRKAACGSKVPRCKRTILLLYLSAELFYTANAKLPLPDLQSRHLMMPVAVTAPSSSTARQCVDSASTSLKQLDPSAWLLEFLQGIGSHSPPRLKLHRRIRKVYPCSIRCSGKKT